MLTVTNLTKRYGKRVLFEKVNLKLDAGKRYGLIGANGAGKSTFLKILAKEEEASEGDIVIAGGLKLGVLSQNQYAYEDYSIKDAVLLGNKRLFNAIKEKEKLYMEGDFESDEVNNRLSDLEIICAEEDPTYEVEVRIEKILEALGFDSSIHESLMRDLPTSDKFKILLAQVLFPKPDILLLDEPTNNLDIVTINWLEQELIRHEGTMIIISHDRHFLNAIVTDILDVDFKTVREFSGNYDDWYIAANLIQKQTEADREKKLKDKAELENFIRRFSANASKAKQATSRQKQLEKLDIAEIQTSARREPNILFKPFREIGNEVLDIENISKSFGDLKVFENLSLKVEKTDKIAIIGGNGVGKSTFCKMITNDNLKPDSGKIKWGVTVEFSYFPQDTTERIKSDMKLYEWLQSFDAKMDLDEIRKALGRMLFSGEEQQKSVKDVSGGEKHRMMLSKMMLEKSNFLILDEPTNHLDLEAIVALGEALYNYPSAVICVTHDRELIDAYANRIIEVKKGGEIVDFRGNYEEYIEFMENQ